MSDFMRSPRVLQKIEADQRKVDIVVITKSRCWQRERRPAQQ